MTTATTLLLLALARAPGLEVDSRPAHNLIAALTVAVIARSPGEARDMFRLAHSESRWTPAAVSSVGACGIWQQVPKWRKTTCRDLARKPVHATLTAFAVTRRMRELCGDRFHVCYTHGPYSKAGKAARKAGFGGRRW
jgi:hypothetical protein